MYLLPPDKGEGGLTSQSVHVFLDFTISEFLYRDRSML